ncbi:unnamed protein product [Amoebophrya sp. A120]|nr:unnamed protein product [Amoebophrya sp. A120]|eukprot:GSA120T00023504001.1
MVQLFWGEQVPLSYLTAVFDTDAVDLFDQLATREGYLWHLGCLDYAQTPRPWERHTWLRLLGICLALCCAISFLTMRAILKKVLPPMQDSSLVQLPSSTSRTTRGHGPHDDVLWANTVTRISVARCSFLSEVLLCYLLFALPLIASHHMVTRHALSLDDHMNAEQLAEMVLIRGVVERYERLLPPEDLYTEDLHKVRFQSFWDFVSYPEFSELHEVMGRKKGELDTLADKLLMNPANQRASHLSKVLADRKKFGGMVRHMNTPYDEWIAQTRHMTRDFAELAAVLREMLEQRDSKKEKAGSYGAAAAYFRNHVGPKPQALDHKHIKNGRQEDFALAFEEEDFGPALSDR